MKYYFIVLLSLISINAHAELHKWTDTNGKVHYSDEPPPPNATETETLHIQSVSPRDTAASAPSGEKSIMEQEAELKKAQKEKLEAAQKEAKRQEEEQTKQQNCAQARSQLLTLQNSPRIATYDANGQRTIMDDTMRQQRIDNAQAAISQFCN